MYLCFADIMSTSTLSDSESVQMISETADVRPSTSATFPSEDIPSGSRYVKNDDLG